MGRRLQTLRGGRGRRRRLLAVVEVVVMLGPVCHQMRLRGLHGDGDRRRRRRSYGINLRTGGRSGLTPKIRGPGLAERAEISIHHAGAARTGTGQNRVYSKTRPAGPFHCCHFYMRSTPVRRSAAAQTTPRKLSIVKQNNTKQCCLRLKKKKKKKWGGERRKDKCEAAIRGHFRHSFPPQSKKEKKKEKK